MVQVALARVEVGMTVPGMAVAHWVAEVAWG